MDQEKVDFEIGDPYQLVVIHPSFCTKLCYDLLDNCKEYIIKWVSIEGMKKLKSFYGRSSEFTFVYVVTNELGEHDGRRR